MEQMLFYISIVIQQLSQAIQMDNCVQKIENKISYLFYNSHFSLLFHVYYEDVLLHNRSGSYI